MGQSIKNGASEICGRQPLNNLKGYGLLKQYIGDYLLALFLLLLGHVYLKHR